MSIAFYTIFVSTLDLQKKEKNLKPLSGLLNNMTKPILT